MDQQLDRQRLGLTDLILCEVLQGVRGDALFGDVRDELLGFHVFETGSKDLAIASALNYQVLREQGHTVGRDFDAFEKALGLRVIHP